MNQTEPELYSGDQTTFSQQAPLFQHTTFPEPEPAMTKKPAMSKKQKIMVGFLGVASLGVILGLIFWYLGRPQSPLTEVEVTPSPTAAPAVVSPLQGRLNEVKADLENADPTRRDLAFPPVDMEVQLSE